MPIATLKSHSVRSPVEIVPLSVDQYQQMIEAGIIPGRSRIELIDGLLVPLDKSHVGEDPMSMGNDHMFVVDELTGLRSLFPPGAYIRIQLAVELLPDSCPEPDAAVVRGTPSDYREHAPRPADISCLIEVADSSLRIDRTTKLRVYADAGIPQYVIINLVEGVIEVYREPVKGEGCYAAPQRLRPGQILSLMLPGGENLDVPVDRFIAGS